MIWDEDALTIHASHACIDRPNLMRPNGNNPGISPVNSPNSHYVEAMSGATIQKVLIGYKSARDQLVNGRLSESEVAICKVE